MKKKKMQVSSVQGLAEAGRSAYQRSQLYRDLFAVFNFEPFQRLLRQLEDPDLAPAVRAVMRLYNLVHAEHGHLSPWERLGEVDALMSHHAVRQAALKGQLQNLQIKSS